MLVVASHRTMLDKPPKTLRVRSNLLGALHLMDSLVVTNRDQPELKPIRYKTVSMFMNSWEIHATDRRSIPVPLLRSPLGLGNVVRYFAEKFPRWFKAYFRGCEDRRMWLNYCVAFVPIGWKEATE